MWIIAFVVVVLAVVVIVVVTFLMFVFVAAVCVLVLGTKELGKETVLFAGFTENRIGL